MPHKWKYILHGGNRESSIIYISALQQLIWVGVVLPSAWQILWQVRFGPGGPTCWDGLSYFVTLCCVLVSNVICKLCEWHLAASMINILPQHEHTSLIWNFRAILKNMASISRAASIALLGNLAYTSCKHDDWLYVPDNRRLYLHHYLIPWYMHTLHKSWSHKISNVVLEAMKLIDAMQWWSIFI